MRRILQTLAMMGLLYSPVASFSMIDPATPPGEIPSNGDPSWVLDFSDEFNGTSLDTTKWGIDVSTSSRGYRPERGINDWWWKAENVSIDGAGNLVIDIVKFDSDTMHCGSVSSDGLYDPLYGYMEARVQIADATKDTHTAFWTQSENMFNGTPPDGTANDGAEVDIFESAWFVGDYTKAVVHIDGYGAGKAASTKQYNTPGLHSGYHTFGMEWNEHVMNIYYDGVLRKQYEGIWVPQVTEFLWLSNGGSFGDIGTFASEPVGWLTSSKWDYVRVWKPASVSTLWVVGGDKMNGNFNADPGNPVSFGGTAGWYNLGTSANQGDVATRNNVTYDGSQNALILADVGREFGLNTGYEMVEGDVFDIGYVWKDDWSWADASDQVRVTLFVTSDDTRDGTRTDLISVLSGVSTQNDVYETVSQSAVYTASASDAGKVLFVSIDGNDSGTGGFARLDNFDLIRYSASIGNSPPTFTADPINASDATEAVPYSDTIAGSATDPDSDPLTYALLPGGAPWLSVASDGTLSGTPGAGDVGPNSFTVEASDDFGGTDTATLNITVNAGQTNQPPVWDFPPTVYNATEGVFFQEYNAWRVSDPEGDTLQWAKVFGPAWVTVVASSGELRGTPGPGDVGTYSITLSVADPYNPPVEATGQIVVDPAPVSTMHVSAIDLSVVNAGGPNRRGVATVTIVDASSQPVSGATVSGTFTGSYNESGSATTNTSGVAVIETIAKKKNPSFTFTVNNVTLSGYTYDPAANVETSDSF